MFFFNLHAAVKYLLVLISTFPHVLSIQIHAHTRTQICLTRLDVMLGGTPEALLA